MGDPWRVPSCRAQLWQAQAGPASNWQSTWRAGDRGGERCPPDAIPALKMQAFYARLHSPDDGAGRGDR
jgi:hypothetical protein